jgi:hypothetical protein
LVLASARVSITRPGRRASLLVVLVVVSAWAFGLARHYLPAILGDDAAITLRYAERIATGRGFTYNDDERVLGASNPLYALLLAVPASLGADVEATARGAATAGLMLSAVLAALLAARLSGVLGGLLAGLLLPAEPYFRSQVLSGMECGLAVCLGLLAILLYLEERPGLAGVAVGLAVWNKLDALALAAALIAVATWRERRVPRSLVLGALLAVMPWLLFALFYFGSPLPQSLLAKLSTAKEVPFDPQWVWDFLRRGRYWTLLLAAIAVALVSIRHRDRGTVARLTLLLWWALHATAYSLVDLGAPYPWYLTVLVPPLVILAATALGRLALPSPHPAWLRATLALGAAAALLAPPGFRDTLRTLREPRPIADWEAFEADRRLAGIFLDQFSLPEEIVASGYGWVAFESRRPFSDGTRLTSTADRTPISYVVSHGAPWQRGNVAPDVPAGMIPLARFDLAHRLYDGWTWFEVFGQPDSAIARAGKDARDVDLSRLRDPRLLAAWQRHGPPSGR